LNKTGYLYFQPKIKNPNAGMWLGANDIDKENFFVWDSSKKLLSQGFRNWDPQWKNKAVTDRA
jgi:hypothetical protein